MQGRMSKAARTASAKLDYNKMLVLFEKVKFLNGTGID